MISERVFKNVWALLCERFNREPSQMMMRAYYHALKDRLTDDEFKAAGSRLFETAEFFPKPADFLPTSEDAHLDAVQQWDVLYSAMCGHASYTDLDEHGQAAVRLLGGPRKLREVLLDEIQYVRRDFLSLYEDAVAIAQREERVQIEGGPEAKKIAGMVKLNDVEEAA